MHKRLGVKEDLFPFAAFFATIPIYSPNIVNLSTSLGESTEVLDWFAQPLMLTVLFVSLAITLLSLWHSLEKLLFKPLALASSSLLYLSGFALMIIGSYDVSMLGSLYMLPGIICGVGLVPLCIAWATLFTSMSIRHALLNLAIFCCLGSIFAFVLASFDGAVLIASYLVMVAIGLITPLAKSLHDKIQPGFNELKPSHINAEDIAIPVRQPGENCFQPFKRLFSVSGSLLLGFIVFAFMMSVRKFSIFGSYDIEILAGIVAPFTVIPLCFINIKRPFFPFVYQEFLPASALAFLVINCFTSFKVFQLISTTGVYLFFAALGLLTLAALCVVVHAREFPPSFVLGVALAAFSLTSFIGVNVGQSIPQENMGYTLFTVSTLYFAGLIGSALVSMGRTLRDSATAKIAAIPVEKFLKTRCDEIAVESSLSPREREILQYIGRGHSPAHIAKMLTLSISTIRTHIRNIYRKIGINSREELMELIDADRINS